MTAEISNRTAAAGAPGTNSGAGTAARAGGAGEQISKESFLQLLVAQIRHQDPLNPADGIQFLTQLAQFSELEQLIHMNEHLEAIRNGLDGTASGDGDGAGDQTAEDEPAGRPV